MPAPNNYQDLVPISVLMDVVHGYSDKDKTYISNKIFPIIPVNEISSDVLKDVGESYSISGPVDTLMNALTGLTKTPIAEFSMATMKGFYAKKYACQTLFTETMAEQCDKNNPMVIRTNLERSLTQKLLQLRNTHQEASCAGVLNALTTGQRVLDLTDPNDRWNKATAKINDNLVDISEIMLAKTGVAPNTMVMPKPIFDKIAGSPGLKSLNFVLDPNNFQLRNLVLAEMESIFKMKILVPDCMGKFAKEGMEDGADFENLWNSTHTSSNKIYLLHLSTQLPMSFLMPGTAFGYNFVYKPLELDKYLLNDPKECYYIRRTEKYDRFVFDADCVYAVSSVV